MLKTKINKLPKSEIEIEGEIPADVFETYFDKALKILGENFKLDGFRQGKIPESVLLKNIPEIGILEKMAELALNEHYPKIIAEEKIDVITRPEISITKLARNNPLGFKIKTAVLPEIKLPDYKNISKKIVGDVTDAEKNVVVSDDDVENTIKDILKSRAPKKHVAEIANTNPEEEKKEELPEFNDEFVKGLGPFKDVADFKDKLKVNIKLEKENAQKEKTRVKIIEKIIEDSTLEVPEILVEIEINKILQRMESDITQMGLKFEDYLKHLNKTVDDLRKEFRNDGEKKAKLALLLNEIAKVEKIVADEALVEREVKAILEHYKDADPERAKMHAENVLTNEKIFQFLENQQ
jgi:FKBP-type peptidyl-prolyl cis-trans isomerase (trigger factor)